MSRIYNRELSWLEFNNRVLQEAQDPSVPLLQRLRFLGIFSNNQDEFIKVRVANLIRFSQIQGRKQPKMTGGILPSTLLSMVNARVNASRDEFRKTYSEIIGLLENENVFMVKHTELSDEQKAFCYDYFLSVISVRLVPVVLKKSVPAPFLADGKVYLGVKMENPRSSRFAIIQVPVSDACPRFVVLPSDEGRTDIIFIDDIIRLFLDEIFFMFSYQSISAHTFKIVRDAELLLDEDVSKSMTQKMYMGITQRLKGRPIRMVYDQDMPSDTLSAIAGKLGFKTADQLDAGGRYHLMRDLMKFPKVNPALEYSNPKPMKHPLVTPFESILKVIKKQDLLLCYPYHSFKPFIDMLREAAVDPMVHSIYITLYRTAKHSKIINALLNAVKNGKQVTAMVELKARFDEEQNISNTDMLQEGGVKVIHSDNMFKVHSKLVLIERSEGSNHNKGYVYVGTGNFNENTASIYSDFGLFTCEEKVAKDARKVFDYLLNTHKHYEYDRLVVSPYAMRDYVISLLDNEISNARRGKKAYFYGKFNALTDVKLIEHLYVASCSGVEIRLIVRGACCLEAGIKGLSENIEVRSIVDKYLEHARMIICCNGGKPTSYITSADLMPRNLDRRVEIGVGIRSGEIHKTLVDYFEIQWRDNVKARSITPPYQNLYAEADRDKSMHRSQVELYEYFVNKKGN
ncbi:MAG: polyphosphate kinase 1 [Rikenellaceae bacterium]